MRAWWIDGRESCLNEEIAKFAGLPAQRGRSDENLAHGHRNPWKKRLSRAGVIRERPGRIQAYPKAGDNSTRRTRCLRAKRAATAAIDALGNTGILRYALDETRHAYQNGLDPGTAA
jgi:hypothetical protein